MSKNRNNRSAMVRWESIHGQLNNSLQHLVPWLDDPDDFIEIRMKARDDGTILTVAKGYDSDGGPIVCFGVGYDVVTSLIAIDSTIASGNWRKDKPWKPNSS